MVTSVVDVADFVIRVLVQLRSSEYCAAVVTIRNSSPVGMGNPHLSAFYLTVYYQLKQKAKALAVGLDDDATAEIHLMATVHHISLAN